MGTILAIDPGNIESGYVLVEHDGEEIRRVLKVGKEPNRIVLDQKHTDRIRFGYRNDCRNGHGRRRRNV